MEKHQGKKTKGGNFMLRLLKKFIHNDKAFTLVELLIVVAILGVLAAVVLPNVIGLADTGQVEAAKAELVTVQTAVDILMAKTHITSVTATAATANMSGFPSSNPLYPDYLRTPVTKGTYSCTTTGLVTQVSTGY
ncbi:MAG: prepilin-type N-terminal cleavage/methylation domain-containing protein [Dehalococcoidales bacterium]|jgi:prepilin-type N-terminal cleavage/methylation domain-containing protein